MSQVGSEWPKCVRYVLDVFVFETRAIWNGYRIFEAPSNIYFWYFLNRAPVIWHIKRQNSADTSTFGSEFTDMKNSVELIVALRYKLRMFGVRIDGSTDIFCDNETVYKNPPTPKVFTM